MGQTIKPLRKGDTLTADTFNAIVKQVLRTIRVAAPLQMTENAAGTFISFAGDFVQREKIIAKAGESGIPQRVGTQPGKAEVTVYEIDDPDADDPVLVVSEEANGDPVVMDAFNLSSVAAAADSWVMLVYGSGVWWVDFEDCPETEE